MKNKNLCLVSIQSAFCTGLILLASTGQSNAQATTSSIFTFENDALVNNFGVGAATNTRTFQADAQDTTLAATFSTVDGLSQYGISDNTTQILALGNISGHLLYGGEFASPSVPKTSTLTVSFSRPVYSFGFDWLAGAYDDAGNPATGGFLLSINPVGPVSPVFPVQTSLLNAADWSQGAFSYNVPGGNPAISSFTLTSLSEIGPIIGIDNLTVTSLSVVPEPGSTALVAAFAATMIGARIRRRSVKKR